MQLIVCNSIQLLMFTVAEQANMVCAGLVLNQFAGATSVGTCSTFIGTALFDANATDQLLAPLVGHAVNKVTLSVMDKRCDKAS